jgi:hypothetical protein
MSRESEHPFRALRGKPHENIVGHRAFDTTGEVVFAEAIRGSRSNGNC